jgi:hypothetical protein
MILVAIRAKLTTADDLANKAAAPAAAAPNAKAPVERSDEEKAKRKERVAAAKDALQRSNGLKGDHVGPARTALKTFLQNLNNPRQPDDATFAAMVEAPFTAPPKKKTNDRRP